MGDWTRMRVLQTGGIAGDIEAPLVDLVRDKLSDAEAVAADQAHAALTAASGAVAGAAKALGADFAGYRVEVEAPSGERRSFALPGPVTSASLAGVDVPQLLATLSAMPQASS